MSNQTEYSSNQLKLIAKFRSRRTDGSKHAANAGHYRRGTDKEFKSFNLIGSKRSINHLDRASQFISDYSGLRGISGNTYGCTDCGYLCKCRIGTGFEKKYSTSNFRSKSPNYPQTLVLA